MVYKMVYYPYKRSKSLCSGLAALLEKFCIHCFLIQLSLSFAFLRVFWASLKANPLWHKHSS